MNIKRQPLVCLWLSIFWWLFSVNASFAAQIKNEYVSIEHAKQEALARSKSALINRATYNRDQPVENIILSPDGLKLSYVILGNKKKHLWVFDVISAKHSKLITAHEFKHLSWTADSKKLVYVDAKRVVSVGLSKQEPAKTRFYLNDENTLFIKNDIYHPDAFWLLQYRVSQKMYALIKVDSQSNESVHYRSPLPIMSFWADSQKVRFVTLMSKEHQKIVYFKGEEERNVAFCDVFDVCKVQFWTPETHTLLVSGQLDNDTATLHTINLKTGVKQVVSQTNSVPFDASQFYVSPDGVPLLMGYETQYVHYEALTPKGMKVLDKLKNRITSNIYRIVPDKLQEHWLVAQENTQTGNMQYSLYLAENDTWLTPLSHLDGACSTTSEAALRVPISYQASDKKQLFGYLTLPNGYEADKVPLIVFPHGGPWNRSKGAYNRISQFLANRGYAVFEPNFRGSTGMGKAYMTSAQREFGNGRVQQDIIDSVDYLLENGIGRADRLAVVGHSFGGFSAINALAFTPSKFSVAFAGAAPNNMSNTISYYKSTIPAALLPMRLPRFEALMVDTSNSQDVARLFEQSPDKHWQQITKPLYMWAGEQDDRVAIEDVIEFALRLEADGKAISLISDTREGHSPTSHLAKEGYLYLLEYSLFTHIHGRMEEKMSPSLKRYLQKFTTIDSNGVKDFE